MAIRPCIAATEASIMTPVQSPAAYTPGAEDGTLLSTPHEAALVDLDPRLFQADPRRWLVPGEP